MDLFPTVSFGSLNVLDIIIVIVVFFYAYEGYILGFGLALLDLFSFVLSFVAALKFYSLLAKLITSTTTLAIGFANAGSFFLIALLAEICLTILFRKLLRFLPQMDHETRIYQVFKRINNILGLIPGAISAFIIIAFLLDIIVSLPSSVFLKDIVTSSSIGSKLVGNTSLFETRLNDVFGGALNETLNFMTVEPQSNEMVLLHFKVTNGTVDKHQEEEMFRMVNEERTKRNLQPVTFSINLTDVGRAHSQDMFARGYFSHYTPEGLTPFDRMIKAGIEFTYAGENLALAPSTDLAMQGLMNSPGHKANILNPNFHKIGIGVVNGGIYGLMYSQEFND